jgi:GxxExxY protein
MDIRDVKHRRDAEIAESWMDIRDVKHHRDAEIAESWMDINNLTGQIIGAAIEVHRAIGPGLLESAYEQCLCRELSIRHVVYERQRALPVDYKGLLLDCGYRLDLLVADLVVVEIKAVETLLPIHEAQLITYLKLGGWHVGLLINFNVTVLKNGIRRRVLGCMTS